MQMSMVMKARMQMRIWMSAIKDGDEGEDVYDDMDEGDRGCKWGWDFVGKIKGHLHSITSHRMHSSLHDTMMIMLLYGDDKQLDIV